MSGYMLTSTSWCSCTRAGLLRCRARSRQNPLSFPPAPPFSLSNALSAERRKRAKNEPPLVALLSGRDQGYRHFFDARCAQLPRSRAATEQARSLSPGISSAAHEPVYFFKVLRNTEKHPFDPLDRPKKPISWISQIYTGYFLWLIAAHPRPCSRVTAALPT